jgi:HK97 family phage major capsid protein
MNTQIMELRDGIAYVEAELAAIHTEAEGRALTDDEQTRWDDGTEYAVEQRKVLEDLEARQAIVDRIESGKTVPQRADSIGGSFKEFYRSRAPESAEAVLEDRSATTSQKVDAITRQAESFDQDESHLRKILKRHSNDDRWLHNMLARSTDVYAEAFNKFLTGRELLLTNEERAALVYGTDASGGYLIPTHLDPSVILSNDGSANALRGISRVVTLTEGNTWNGVSSAGVTASWDTELTEVSDDSPTFANPQVPLYKAQAFVQASFEAMQDINGLAGEVMMMFADAKDRLEGAAHCSGSGSDQPTGIFTAINAGGNETVSTTAATIGLVDLQATRRAVGQRWRNRAYWVTNPEWGDEIKRLGAALSASYSTDITQSNTDRLLGRPLIETDDAPTTATTTVLDERVVFGDFQNFVIADKPGSMAMSYIPHLFNTSNNLPMSVGGWHMFWRTGSDSVNDAAFQLLMDKTSA